MHKHAAVPRLFCDLRYVVIDEVHSLLRGDRGGQTLCLIERLGRMAGVNPRRIGLSATIGDRNVPVRFSPAAQVEAASSRALRSRAASGAFPWSTSISRAPRQPSRALQDHGPQQADVLKVERVAGGEDRGGAER